MLKQVVAFLVLSILTLSCQEKQPTMDEAITPTPPRAKEQPDTPPKKKAPPKVKPAPEAPSPTKPMASKVKSKQGLILPRDADRPVASIAEEPITLDQLISMFEDNYSPGCRTIFSGSGGSRVMDISLPLLTRLQLDLMVVRKEAKKRGIVIDKTGIKQALETKFNERMKKKIWNDPPREKLIRANREHDFKVFRRTAGPRSEIEVTLSTLCNNPFTQKELKAFYRNHGFRPAQKVKVAHIFIPRLDPKTNRLLTLEGINERKKLLLDIKERLKKDSSNFAEVAKKYSALPKTARRGGYLGEVSRWSDKYPAISRAVFSLKKSQWTGPVEEAEGFHFLQCLKMVSRKSYLFHQINRKELERDMRLERQENLLYQLRNQYRTRVNL